MATRYSLAQYILSIKLPTELANDLTGESSYTLSIGGEQSYTGSITVSMAGTLWTTTGDVTGSWYHSKSLDQTGTVAVNINQLAEEIQTFIKICEIYYRGSYEGCTVTVTDSVSNTDVCTAEDCYITKIPDQAFGTSPADQTWTITCGRISYN